MKIINSCIRVFLYSFLILNLILDPAFAQTATILPQAETQFLDNNGNPVSSGTVDFYIPNSNTRKATWQDSSMSISNTNPVVLDASGRALIYGYGAYRQVLKDSSGNVIWDRITNSYSIPNGQITTGDGDAVGTVKAWSGLVAPNQYVFAYGEELARTTYPDLLSAITLTQNFNCTSGNNTVSGISDTSQTPIGASIESSCFSGTVTVSSKTSTTYTVSANAIITSSGVSSTVFPFGNGNGSTTFNVPDLRGRVLAGRDNMGGIPASRLTSTYFANASSIGAAGGSQYSTLTTANLPPYTPSGTITLPTNAGSTVVAAAGGGSPFSGSAGNSYSTINLTATFNGTPQGGTSTPFSTVQPAITINYIIKIVPDATGLVAAGVQTVGNMAGIIACDNTLTCENQVIGISPTGLSTLMDNSFGTTQGSIIYRDATAWNVLTPGTAGFVLSTGGSGANPLWIANTNPSTPQAANTISAGPTSGPNASPSFRPLVSADIPSSVALTGTPTAPTAPNGTNTTQIATTAYVLSNGATSNASKYGIKCDGTTDDGPAFKTAFESLNGTPLILPAGTCKIATTAFLNKWTTPGILTVPGVKVIGQGRGVTIIDAEVSNGYAISVNPDWAALHNTMFIVTPTTGGSLATGTYYIQTTVTDPSGNEINVSPPKSVSVTGPSGMVNLNMKPLNTGYCYNVYLDTVNPPSHRAHMSASDAVCIGGSGATNFVSIGAAAAVPTNKVAVWQEAGLSNLSVSHLGAASNASGVLWFRVGYSLMSNVYMKGLTGDGLDIPNWTGDNDGSFVVTVDQSKFDSISGTCIMAAGNSLEFSNFTVSNSVFNLCGTQPVNMGAGWTVSNITNANPATVTTSVANSILSGDQVFMSAPSGMSLASGMYRACGTVTSTTFQLCDLNGANVNTTSSGTFTGTSQVNLEWRPPQMQANGNGPSISGAIAYTGLISNFINNGFTQNKNYDFYLSEAGSNDNITMTANDMENTYGKGIYAASVINLNWTNGECLSTSSLGPTMSCMQFGTGLNKGGAQNVTINGIKVRTDVGVSNGFEQLLGSGGLSFQPTFSVKNVYWQTFSGQNKYVGFQGNPFPLFWARMDGKTGGICSVQSSLNIASCVRNSTGNYTLTIANPALTSTSYTVSGNGSNIGVSPAMINVASIGASSFTFTCIVPSTLAAQDCDIMSIQGFANPN